jgi:hypothetical protein
MAQTFCTSPFNVGVVGAIQYTNYDFKIKFSNSSFTIPGYSTPARDIIVPVWTPGHCGGWSEICTWWRVSCNLHGCGRRCTRRGRGGCNNWIRPQRNNVRIGTFPSIPIFPTIIFNGNSGMTINFHIDSTTNVVTLLRTLNFNLLTSPAFTTSAIIEFRKIYTSLNIQNLPFNSPPIVVDETIDVIVQASSDGSFEALVPLLTVPIESNLSSGGLNFNISFQVSCLLCSKPSPPVSWINVVNVINFKVTGNILGFNVNYSIPFSITCPISEISI